MISAGDSWLPRAVHASKETCSQKTDPPYNSLKQNATLNRRSCNCLGRRTAILRSTINSQRAVRTYVRMQPSIHPSIHACVHTYTDMHTYIHTHLLTYIHTHTHDHVVNLVTILHHTCLFYTLQQMLGSCSFGRGTR